MFIIRVFPNVITMYLHPFRLKFFAVNCPPPLPLPTPPIYRTYSRQLLSNTWAPDLKQPGANQLPNQWSNSISRKITRFFFAVLCYQIFFSSLCYCLIYICASTVDKIKYYSLFIIQEQDEFLFIFKYSWCNSSYSSIRPCAKQLARQGIE